MEKILQVLFPVHPIRANAVDESQSTKVCPVFIVKKLEEAVLIIKDKQASASDGIPSKILEQEFSQTRYSVCLAHDGECFPAR